MTIIAHTSRNDIGNFARGKKYFYGFEEGDFGVSYLYDVPVSELIAERIPITLPLAFSGMALATFLAVVSGTVVIENVFYLPGLGRLILQSISNRDLFTVQALVMMFAVTVVLANFAVDIAYVLIDPRLKGRSN